MSTRVGHRFLVLRWIFAVTIFTLFSAACGGDDGGTAEEKLPTSGDDGGRGRNKGDGGGAEKDAAPDDTTLAPCARPLNQTTATDFYDAAKCLFEGPEAVQIHVAPRAITRERVAIVRGRVVDVAGAPIADVRVTIAQHPEFGETKTGPDGLYHLAINGGGLTTVRIEKDGRLSSQRHRTTEWRAFSNFPDVVLIPEAPPSLPVAFEANDATVIRTTPSMDQSGQRETVLLVPPHTRATMRMPNGSKQPLSTGSIRITEYTVGPRGPAAMPGNLPPSSGYTYASEFSVDEAKEAGATGVDFDPPLAVYVDNFLHFPVGTVVPSGSYDPARDLWEPSSSGRVLRILSADNGSATIDANGDGAPETPAQLAELGITAEELRALGKTFAAGKTLWRAPLAHFSAWDLNWPFGPPGDAISPEALAELLAQVDCNHASSGSIIGCEGQTLGEVVGIPGAGIALVYQSDRTPGRADQNRLRIPMTGASLPASVKRVELEVEVLGQITKQTFPSTPNQIHEYAWDGKDAFGRLWQGGQTAEVRIGYVYDGSYQKTERFAQSGNGTAITGDKTREEVILWSRTRVRIGAFQAKSTR